MMMKKSATNRRQLAVVEPASVEASESAIAPNKQAQQQLLDELIPNICKFTGTQSLAVGDRIIHQTAVAQAKPEDPASVDAHLIQAISSIREMAPENFTQSMLAVQMIATNEAGLRFLAISIGEDQTTESIDANVNRAARLMRLFLQQAEAMQKLKGKSVQQTFSVEQVNVHQGGQAIVGSVGTSREAE